MREVAKAAGVSLKTVSRVLNDEPGVVDDTASRVRAAVNELGFTRNENAAGLRRHGQTTATIGLITEDVSNPFYSTLARAVEAVVDRLHYVLFTGSSAEQLDRERHLVETFCARRVDGLIIVPAPGDHSFLAAELERGTGVVFVDRESTGVDVDTVVSANASGARAGVEHLIAHGHTRIAYIGDAAAISTAQQRVHGYRKALRNNGIVVDESLVRLGSHDAAAAAHAVRDLLSRDRPPTAVFTGNNLLTVGAFRALRTFPERVALVGFDDFELADLLDPPITTVAQDVSALGRTAAQMLLARLADPDRVPSVVTIPTTLIVRGSGEVHR